MASKGMVTTVGTETRERAAVTRPVKGKGLDGAGRRAGGNGSRGPRPPGGGGGGRAGEDSQHPYRIGIWVLLAAVLMMFMALTSAYVFRAGGRGWQPLIIPRWLWVSTAVLVASSAAFELARRALKAEDHGRYRRWLTVSLGLGLAFIAAQLMAWRELVGQGIYLASNPHSSFFYLLTSLHAFHLFGGLVALGYLLWRSGPKGGAREGDKAEGVRRRAAADAVGVYWHFMDVLWIYLFGLLFLWR